MPPPADFLARLEAAEMRDNIDGESAAGGAAAAMPVGAGAVPAEERPMSAEATAAPPVNRLHTRDSLTEPSGPGQAAPPPSFVVPEIGISVQAARKMLQQTIDAGVAEPLTSEVCFKLVKPATAEARISYCEMLWKAGKDMPTRTAPKGKILKADVGKASVFVSHAWSRPFAETVEAMASWERSHRSHALGPVFFWVDIAAVNQHISLGQSEEWAVCFGAAIRSMGRVCLVATPWDQPVCITRAWCLWEIFSAAMSDETELEVCLPDAERKAYEASLKAKGGCEAAAERFAAIDMQTAEASVAADKASCLPSPSNPPPVPVRSPCASPARPALTSFLLALALTRRSSSSAWARRSASTL